MKRAALRPAGRANADGGADVDVALAPCWQGKQWERNRHG